MHPRNESRARHGSSRAVVAMAVVVVTLVALMVVRTTCAPAGPGSSPAVVSPVAQPPSSRGGAPRAAPPVAPSPQAPAASSAPPPVAQGPAPAGEPPSAGNVPADAVVLVAADGVRGWLAVERAPRGLVSEPGAVPGRIGVRLSRVPRGEVTFRASVEPDGALRLPRDPLVRVRPPHDATAVAIAGVNPGPAVIVLTPAQGADAGVVPLRVQVEVRASADFPDPVLMALSAPPDASMPGRRPAGDRRISGVRGTACGAILVVRSAFRGFATEATEVLVSADDPAGILTPLPQSVTIPAGRSQPDEPIRITLRDAVGRAVVRLRAAGQEVELAVDSVDPDATSR